MYVYARTHVDIHAYIHRIASIQIFTQKQRVNNGVDHCGVPACKYAAYMERAYFNAIIIFLNV